MGCTAAIILNQIIPDEAMETPLPTKAVETVEENNEQYPQTVAPGAAGADDAVVAADPVIEKTV